MKASLQIADRLTRGNLSRAVRAVDRVLLQNPSNTGSEYTDWLDPWYLEETRNTKVDVTDLRAFEGKHSGQRCFIIGNGPSLNRVDFSRLSAEITFGVNGFFLKTEETGFIPTYYVVEDRFVMEDNLAEIDAYRTTHRFFPSIYRSRLTPAPQTSYFLMNRGFYEPSSPFYGLPRFSTDCSRRIYTGQSVTYINLQLAYYMGFETVYLLGMDFNYVIPESLKRRGVDFTSTEKDPNHFHPSYFGPGKRWHDPQLDRVARSYEYARLVYKWGGRRILNATHGGALEVFERVEFDQIFQDPRADGG